MERRWIWLTAVLSIALLAAVIVLGAALGYTPGQSGTADPGAIKITEVMASNETYVDEQGRLLDYIELYNPTDNAVDISGYKLSDDPTTIGYTFPQGTVLEAGEYRILQCDPTADAESYAAFRISRDGETLYLYNSANVMIQTLMVPALPDNQPYMLAENGQWEVGQNGTPGFANTEEGFVLWLESNGISAVNVVISEVQTANRSAITDSHGNLCDWVELQNVGQTEAVLNGYYLSDNPEKPMKWQLPNLILAAGQRIVIPCTGIEGVENEAPFALSKNSCQLVLSGPVGNYITGLEVPAMEADTSYQLADDGSYIVTEKFTPGYENTEEGYEAFRASQELTGPLVVWEVMPANDRYLIQSDGECYDWVELKNISGSTLNLADFSISDDADMPELFRLPDMSLAAGDTVVVILSGDTELTGRYIHAPFSLDRQKCWIYVSQKGAGFCDYVRIQNVPVLGTAGRVEGQSGIFYFTTPTPDAENSGGVSAMAASPFVQTPGGIYNDVTSVSVVLSGEGDIRYTLDGSEPTINSRLYTDPIILTKTTTLRARCYAEGKLESQVVTTGYIINENHTLPVLSISADPDAMLGPYGIYMQFRQNREIPCNMTLYEDGGSFSIDCGIKMFGHTGLQMAKKSFKVNFRGRYGADYLSYPVYGEEGPEVYDSLVIRSGQDYPQTIFRDELFTSLCRQMSDNVLAQRDKFCILYINGEYRGIYCIKEAFSETFYATNRNVSEESVEIVQAPVYTNTDVFRFMNYLSTHDVTDPEVYEYCCTVMNMESLIDWMIIQGYSTNGDVQQNLRYFRSTETGYTYEMAFYDLDWAFYYHLPFTDILSNDRQMSWQHLRITMKLIKNPTFRQQFLERLSYHMEHTLSNENVLARIDYYQKLLEPEVARERQRWGGTYQGWINQINRMKRFITQTDHMKDIVNRLVRYIGLTQAEINKYFWRWA